MNLSNYLRLPPLHQRSPVELAAFGLGQRGAEHDLLWRLEGGEAVAAMAQQLVGIHRHAVHVVDDTKEQDSGDPGPGSPPSEPEQSARPQLRNHGLLGSSVQFSFELAVHEVEKIQMSYP